MAEGILCHVYKFLFNTSESFTKYTGNRPGNIPGINQRGYCQRGGTLCDEIR